VSTATNSTERAVSLRQTVREDWIANRRSWSSPGLHALAVHRLGTRLDQDRRTRGIRQVLSLAHRVLFVIVRNVYGIELSPDAKIGRRFRIAHQGGIVVGGGVVIGDDCFIRHNVTIGWVRGRELARGDRYAPRIGSNVEIGPGAVVLGGIDVGDGSKIGPNAVVLADVPAGSRAFAPPAKVMRTPPGAPDTPRDEGPIARQTSR
jgi:serine O-acetyltransferase